MIMNTKLFDDDNAYIMALIVMLIFMVIHGLTCH